ncbi:MAG: hypothetical protein WDA75_24860, partial [Candidatus Latescibacterota bacterium]
IWQGLHQRPAPPAETAAILGLEVPAKADLLVRSQAPRHAFRRREGFSLINYGRFSEDSSLQCRFVVPEPGKPSCLLVRGWKDAGEWQRFIDPPPAAVRRLIAEGWGVLVPLLFGQARVPALDEARRAIEDSYLFTTYNRTTAMQQAGDLVTTVRLAELELGVSPSSLAVVAEGSPALIALAAWAFLSAGAEIGPFAGDLDGADLADPATWTESAYVPLLLGAGGIRALASLAGRRTAHLTGVPASCRALLPRSFKTRTRTADLAGLLRLLQAGKRRRG